MFTAVVSFSHPVSSRACRSPCRRTSALGLLVFAYTDSYKAGNDLPAHTVECMLSLTTAQRDLLQLLLTIDTPIGAAALGQRLHLTPRQVHYSLRDIKTWLSRRHATLRHAPGIGVQLICTPQQRE